MKFLYKFLSIFILSIFLLLEAFALDAPTNLKLDSVDDSSVNLSWDAPEGSYMYYITYSKVAGNNDGTESQTDFIEETNLVIDSLEKGATYYFSVTALDENGDGSSFSNEISVDILSEETNTEASEETNTEASEETNTEASEEVNFTLEKVNVISSAEIELVFSNGLDNTEGTEREFNIYNKSDKLDSFGLLSVDINEEDNTKLNLTLDREMEEGVAYEIVIIAIKNSLLNNIESGIDSVESFLFEKESIVSVTKTEEGVEGTVKTEEGVEGTTETEEGVELNSASEKNLGPSGVDIDENEIKNTTLGASENSTQLPKTGPEHILMFILSIILGTLIFVFKYKKA